MPLISSSSLSIDNQPTEDFQHLLLPMIAQEFTLGWEGLPLIRDTHNHIGIMCHPLAPNKSEL